MNDDLNEKDSQRILDEMKFGTPNTPKRVETIRRAKEVYAKARPQSLEELLAEVVQWGEETFPTVSLRAKIEHLRREVDELQKTPTAAEEIADIMMITAHIASEVGVDLTEAIADKFEIVKAREWDEPDADGVVEHKKVIVTEPGGVRKNTPRYLLEDLLHVYDNWTDPRIKLARLLSLVDRGWVYENREGELVIWEVTGLGWAALESVGLVPKTHGGR